MNRNGNIENLIPMAERSQEERQEIARKGGKRKAEKARRCKQVTDTFNAILALEYENPTPFEVEWHHTHSVLDRDDFWVDLEGQNLLMRLCCGVVAKAMRGDMQACRLVFQYIEPPGNDDENSTE